MWSAYVWGGVAALLIAFLFITAAPALPSPTAVSRLMVPGTAFLGLGFGISRHSRICAVLAFMALFSFVGLLSPIIVILGLPALISFYGLIRGILGTFAYHRHLAGAK